MLNILKAINKDIEEFKLREFINALEEHGDIIFFGGYIREKYLSLKTKPRDIDIVFDSGEANFDLRSYLINDMKVDESLISLNEYGGLKIHFKAIKIDIWNMLDTEAFKNNLRECISWRNLTDTTYSNFDAISFNYSCGELDDYKFQKIFKSFMIDTVLEDNKDILLNLTKLLVHKNHYQSYFEKELIFSDSIRKEYLNNFDKIDQMCDKQIARYGKCIVSEDEIKNFILGFDCF